MGTRTIEAVLLLAALPALAQSQETGKGKATDPWTVVRVSSAEKPATRSMLAAGDGGLSLAWIEGRPPQTWLAVYDPDAGVKHRFAKRAVMDTKLSTHESAGLLAIAGGGTDGGKRTLTGLATNLSTRDGTGSLAFVLCVEIAAADPPGSPRVTARGRVFSDTKKFRLNLEEGGLSPAPERARLIRRQGKPDRLLALVSDAVVFWSSESTDGGKTWSPYHLFGRGQGRCGDVVEAKGELVMASVAPSRQLQLMRSADGKNWSRPNVILPEARPAWHPSLAVDAEGTIWLAFSQETRPNKKAALFLSQSSDRGNTWSPPVKITDGLFFDTDPQLARLDERLFVSFTRLPAGPAAGAAHQEIWSAHAPVRVLSPKK